MELDSILKRSRKLARRYRVDDGRGFRLRDVDPGDTAFLEAEDKPEAVAALRDGVATLATMQEMLFAQDRWAVLLIFQAMDAAGKDGAIKHVMSGVNPQGCQVASFKAPVARGAGPRLPLALRRAQLPERGRIGIFNRSYYEEVLVVRVHPELLHRQKLPARARRRRASGSGATEDIRAFERYLARNGVAIRKFFLHVSKGEQKRRFLERIEQPEKNWKFEAGDVAERDHWDEYMKAYEEMIRETSAPHAPWFVVPADNKWFTRIVVMSAVIDALDELGLAYPEADKAQRAALAAAEKALRAE